jgi:hypothetical protein
VLRIAHHCDSAGEARAGTSGHATANNLGQSDRYFASSRRDIVPGRLGSNETRYLVAWDEVFARANEPLMWPVLDSFARLSGDEGEEY